MNSRLRLRLPLGRWGWDARSSTLLGAAFTNVLNGAASGACVRVLLEHGANGQLFEDDQDVAADGNWAFHLFELATVESFLDAYDDEDLDPAARVASGARLMEISSEEISSLEERTHANTPDAQCTSAAALRCRRLHVPPSIHTACISQHPWSTLPWPPFRP